VLTESFYGREDHGLTDRLMAELPGILNWAIEGWQRLRERGFFIQPASAIEVVEEMEALGSPIGAFLEDCCEIGPGKSVSVSELFFAWENWCMEQRRDRPGTKQNFGRELRAALPGIKRVRPRDGSGEREPIYEGICLKACTPPTGMSQADLYVFAG
jgi:putative DNA primase/helicase